MKARVSNLTKTEAEWSKINFIPLPGELVVYAPDDKFKYARFKIGDGNKTLQKLPFVMEAVASETLASYKRAEVFDAGRITDYCK